MDTSSREVNCLICGNKTKILHFRVASCRACSVFFRRSVTAKKEYFCQTGTKNCNLKGESISRTLCRYCRFERCKQVGMKFETEKLLYPSHSASDPPPCIEFKPYIKRKSSMPELNLPDSTSTRPLSASSGSTIDTEFEYRQSLASVLEPQIREIFSQMYVVSNKFSCLEQLQDGFENFYQEIKPSEEICLLDEVDVDQLESFQTTYMLEFAKVLMHCQNFASLDLEDKMLIYNHVRPIFDYLERLYTSAKISHNEQMHLVLYKDSAVDLYGPLVFPKNCDHQKFSKTYDLWVPFREKLVNRLFVPLKNLNITQFELVYLCAYLLWSIQEIDSISSLSQQIAISTTNQITQELHNYYTIQLNMPYYTPRLLNLIKLIDGAKDALKEFNDVLIKSQVFGIYDFKVDLSTIVNGF